MDKRREIGQFSPCQPEAGLSRICRSGRHVPAALVVWNCGFRFSTCVNCGRDIVGAGYEPWTLPPSGTRVAWKSDPPGRYLTARPRVSTKASRSQAVVLWKPTLLGMIGAALFLGMRRGRRTPGRAPIG